MAKFKSIGAAAAVTGRPTASATIGVARRESDHALILTCKDDGPGVPEEALSQLFDPFYRLEADRARNTGGSGLGLTIVRQLVEAMGGRVTCESVHADGSGARAELALEEGAIAHLWEYRQGRPRLTPVIEPENPGDKSAGPAAFETKQQSK